MFLVCNAYYNIITLYSRQAFFEYFFIFSKSTRYCTFSVFLSFILQLQLVKLLFFYHFFGFSQFSLLYYIFNAFYTIKAGYDFTDIDCKIYDKTNNNLIHSSSQRTEPAKQDRKCAPSSIFYPASQVRLSSRYFNPVLSHIFYGFLSKI